MSVRLWRIVISVYVCIVMRGFKVFDWLGSSHVEILRSMGAACFSFLFFLLCIVDYRIDVR